MNSKMSPDSLGELKKLLEEQELEWGADNDKVADTLTTLADLLSSQKRYLEAEPLYWRVLEIRHKLFGQHDRAVAATLRDLGRFYEIQDNLGEAERFFHWCYDTHCALGNPDDESCLSALQSLQKVLALQGKGEAKVAKPRPEKPAAGLSERFPFDEYLTRASKSLSGGNFDEAEQLLKLLSDVCQSFLGKSLAQAQVMHKLGKVCLRRKEFNQGLAHCQQALSVYEELLGAADPSIAYCLADMAELQRGCGDNEEACFLYNWALTIFEQARGFESDEALDIKMRLAGLRQGQSQPAGETDKVMAVQAQECLPEQAAPLCAASGEPANILDDSPAAPGLQMPDQEPAAGILPAPESQATDNWEDDWKVEEQSEATAPLAPVSPAVQAESTSPPADDLEPQERQASEPGGQGAAEQSPAAPKVSGNWDYFQELDKLQVPAPEPAAANKSPEPGLAGGSQTIQPEPPPPSPALTAPAANQAKLTFDPDIVEDKIASFLWEKYLSTGKTALERKNFLEAERNFTVAIEKAKQFGSHDIRLRESMCYLAATYETAGKHFRAERLYQECLTLCEKFLGLEHVENARYLHKLGDLHSKQGEAFKAELTYERAIKILIKSPDINNELPALQNKFDILAGEREAKQKEQNWQK